MQLKNYYTTFFGMAQATAAWLLCIVATDAYRSVACLSSDKTAVIKKKLKEIPWDIACIVLMIVAFYSAYLPPVRVLLFRVDKNAFFMCNVPFENHWDFRIHEVSFCSHRLTDASVIFSNNARQLTFVLGNIISARLRMPLLSQFRPSLCLSHR